MLIGRGVRADLNRHKPVPQTGALTIMLRTHGSRWNQTTDEKGMNLLFYHWTILPRRKMLGSNQRRFYPHGLANRCINRSANLPRWKQLDLNQWSFDYQSNALPTKLCFQGGNNRIWTDNTLFFKQVLYQLELCSQVFLTGFEPVLQHWKCCDLTASR